MHRLVVLRFSTGCRKSSCSGIDVQRLTEAAAGREVGACRVGKAMDAFCTEQCLTILTHGSSAAAKLLGCCVAWRRMHCPQGALSPFVLVTARREFN